jgi:hypothetical protein
MNRLDLLVGYFGKDIEPIMQRLYAIYKSGGLDSLGVAYNGLEKIIKVTDKISVKTLRLVFSSISNQRKHK